MVASLIYSPTLIRYDRKKKDKVGFYSEIMDDEIQLNCQSEEPDEEFFMLRSC